MTTIAQNINDLPFWEKIKFSKYYESFIEYLAQNYGSDRIVEVEDYELVCDVKLIYKVFSDQNMKFDLETRVTKEELERITKEMVAINNSLDMLTQQNRLLKSTSRTPEEARNSAIEISHQYDSVGPHTTTQTH